MNGVVLGRRGPQGGLAVRLGRCRPVRSAVAHESAAAGLYGAAFHARAPAARSPPPGVHAMPPPLHSHYPAIPDLQEPGHGVSCRALRKAERGRQPIAGQSWAR